MQSGICGTFKILLRFSQSNSYIICFGSGVNVIGLSLASYL